MPTPALARLQQEPMLHLDPSVVHLGERVHWQESLAEVACSTSKQHERAPYLILALVHLCEGVLVAVVVDLHIGAQALPHGALGLFTLHTTLPYQATLRRARGASG